MLLVSRLRINRLPIVHDGNFPVISWKYSNIPGIGNQKWVKEYNVTDHLGSVITTFRVDENDNGQVVSKNYFNVDGREIELNIQVSDKRETRFGFIGKENDVESGLGDFGVRKYSQEIGRFTSVDKLWEKYYAWSPYQYSMNNPVNYNDPNGELVVSGTVLVIWGAVEVGLAIYDAYDTYQTIADENTSPTEKVIAGTLFVGGALLPGGGYSQADNVAKGVYKAGKEVLEEGAEQGAKKVAKKEFRNVEGKVLADSKGVKVKSYGTNDVHQPAHAHVSGGGKTTRIGPKGKPLKGEPELTPRQRKVVDSHKKIIRKELNKVGRANMHNEKIRTSVRGMEGSL